jgi:hypothetical protein
MAVFLKPLTIFYGWIAGPYIRNPIQEQLTSDNTAGCIGGTFLFYRCHTSALVECIVMRTVRITQCNRNGQ